MSEETPQKTGQESQEETRVGSAVPANAVDLMHWCISALAAGAWQEMGLVPNPATNKIERNLDNARLAIDATAALIDLLKPQLDPRAQRELDTLLANLRLNFVEQKSKA